MKDKFKHLLDVHASTFRYFLAGVLCSVFIFSLLLNTTDRPKPAPQANVAAVAEVINEDALYMSESEPVRLRIPKLSIDTTFTPPLDILDSGEVQVPDSNTEVGWYKYSPTPGEIGPSVVLGHVDSYTGPAVFFYLGQLEPGDDVYIERQDGTIAHFKVDSLERPKQVEFPTERVYGNIDHAGLRLITCSGIYIKGQQAYTHNLIVYASLVAPS